MMKLGVLLCVISPARSPNDNEIREGNLPILPMQMEGITPPLPCPRLLLLLLIEKGEGKLPPPSCFC